MANDKLLVKKRIPRKGRWIKETDKVLTFSVIDLEKGPFPFNFICNLLKTCFNKSDFSKVFVDPIKMAVELLTVAKKEYGDLAIQQEIDLRLSLIESKL
jgi:hypothetical protein